MEEPEEIIYRNRRRGITYTVNFYYGGGKWSVFQAYSNKYKDGRLPVATVFCDIENKQADLYGGASKMEGKRYYSGLIEVAHKYLVRKLKTKPPISG